MSDIEILDIDLDDIIIESGNENEKMASNVSVDSENDRKKNVRKVVSGGGKAPHVAVSFKPVRKPQVAETEKINERRISRSIQDEIAHQCHQKTVPYQTFPADHHGTCCLPHAWPWNSRSKAGRRRWFKARGGEGAEPGPGSLLGR